MEDRRPGRDEDLVLQHRPRDVGVRPDQAVVADHAAVPGARPDHRVLHHDALPTDPDAAAGLADQRGHRAAPERPGRAQRHRRRWRPGPPRPSGRPWAPDPHVPSTSVTPIAASYPVLCRTPVQDEPRNPEGSPVMIGTLRTVVLDAPDIAAAVRVLHRAGRLEAALRRRRVDHAGHRRRLAHRAAGRPRPRAAAVAGPGPSAAGPPRPAGARRRGRHRPGRSSSARRCCAATRPGTPWPTRPGTRSTSA